ncbi:hypothetical protein GC722_00600 [Auraticoccus sp. F435]|uniref:DUF624 domain-containing protein n=1 Tax=Auraticoccus cholistanensis TaxID=2656650 RepID=A0A6A9US11_9ACTN|nr:hypothetical protein [Auraticoccus cholistanensis]MVA74542.1 hypothetical protein [Auraticoccus cholistanensis]
MSPVVEGDVVRRGAALVWPELPLLVLGSVPVALGWAAVRQLSDWSPWLALAGVGLVVLPLLAALVHACSVLLDGDHVGVRRLFATLPGTALRAAGVTVVPTTTGLLTLVAVHAWQLSGQPWLLASVAVGCVATLAAGYVAVVAVPYALRTGAGVREVALVSLFVATRNAVPVLSVLATATLAVLVAAHLSLALLVLLPAPVALVWAAAASAATARSRARLAHPTPSAR